eukprot:14662796-Alexandrium_andersonii.AAC.1
MPCEFVCVCASTNACVHGCAWACGHECMCGAKRACVLACVQVYVWASAREHTRTRICGCALARVRAH